MTADKVSDAERWTVIETRQQLERAFKRCQGARLTAEQVAYVLPALAPDNAVGDEVTIIEAMAEAGHLVINPQKPWAGVHENGKARWREVATAMRRVAQGGG